MAPSRPWTLAAIVALSLLLPGCFSSGGDADDRPRVDSRDDEDRTSPGDEGPDGEPGDDPAPGGGTEDPVPDGNGTESVDPAPEDGNQSSPPSPPAPPPTPEEGPVAPMPQPPSSVGSWWKYTAVAPGYTHSLTRQVSAMQEREGYESLRWDARKVIPSTGATITDETVSWQRTQDSSWTEVQSTKTTDTDWGDFTSYSKVDYEPPCPDLQWPLTVGTSWQTLCTYTKSEDGRTSSGSVLTNYTVASFDQVVVPAGTFGAYRVEVERQGSVLYEHWSPEACGVVRTQNADSSYVMYLESYACEGA